MIKIKQVYRGQIIAEEGSILDEKHLMIVVKGSVQVLKCLSDSPRKQLSPSAYIIKEVEQEPSNHESNEPEDETIKSPK
jgi:CRP-like cAMP-binding protein